MHLALSHQKMLHREKFAPCISVSGAMAFTERGSLRGRHRFSTPISRGPSRLQHDRGNPVFCLVEQERRAMGRDTLSSRVIPPDQTKEIAKDDSTTNAIVLSFPLPRLSWGVCCIGVTFSLLWHRAGKKESALLWMAFAKPIYCERKIVLSLIKWSLPSGLVCWDQMAQSQFLRPLTAHNRVDEFDRKLRFWQIYLYLSIDIAFLTMLLK